MSHVVQVLRHPLPSMITANRNEVSARPMKPASPVSNEERTKRNRAEVTVSPFHGDRTS